MAKPFIIIFSTLLFVTSSSVNVQAASGSKKITVSLNESGIDDVDSILDLYDVDADDDGITGGYAVCPDQLEYCRPTSAGASTGIYSGFSEGDNSLQGQLWSSLTDSGQENSLENLPISGGGATWAAAIQPRVGRDRFRPGDSYRVDFVDEDNSVVARKALTLPPYFLTVPAVRSYNVTDNDASNDVLVDYAYCSWCRHWTWR